MWAHGRYTHAYPIGTHLTRTGHYELTSHPGEERPHPSHGGELDEQTRGGPTAPPLPGGRLSMHPTKNRLSWMELAAAPPSSAHIWVGALGGRGERKSLLSLPPEGLLDGFWLLAPFDPSGEPVQSSTAANKP